MAAKNFGRVNVSITASTGGLTAGVSQATKTLTTFSSKATAAVSPLRALSNAATSTFGGLGSFAGAIKSAISPLRMLSSVAQSTFGQLAMFSMARSAVNTFTGMASAAAENIDVQGKLSRRLGTTYGELAGLKLAGDLAGVGIDAIGKSMTKVDVAMQKAAGGSKSAQEAFATLGLTAEHLQGMSSADRFTEIASSIASLQTPAQRAAAAVALFGDEGAQLLPMFEGGAESIRRTTKEAELFGLTLTNAQVSNVEEMNDSFTRVYASIQGVVQQVVAHLAPAITAIAKQFTDFVGSIGGANIGQAIGEALLQGAEYLAQVGDYIILNFGPMLQQVFSYLSQVGEQWGAIWEIASRVGSFLSGVFNAFTAGMQTIVLGFSKVAEYFGVDGAKQFSQGLQEGIQKDLEQSQAGFAEAFGSTQAKATEAVAAGPLKSLLTSARDQARSAAAAIDQKTQGIEIPAKLKVNSKELKALVAGSSEGEAFRNSLIRGADPRITGDANQERTADATERAADGIDELASILQDQLALAEISV